jgi:rRNA maturation endonuclease Nob1
MESNQEGTQIRMGQRNVYCHGCEKQDNYMVNLNDVKCKFCGSPAVEFTAKKDVKRTKS